ncbi:MAG TPA: GNAT family N-acetyltransferase [Saprospiraceae bacterium]|nr:GNAT family N-acetyltransferase [Saprospiraceae bacterium]HND88143.1 GNAT family N-acetyltransferase [Saprospiraceae bacterium]HNG90475.1 GNAT family N-acetyltransferase [Saprospiraceae bacterium]
MYIIQTERLRVRPLKDADFPDIYALLSHEETMRYIAAPMTEQTLHERWAKWMGYAALRPGLGTFVLEQREDAAFAGICVARQVEYDPDQSEYEIGYIFVPPLWGKGLASELVPPLCVYCFSKAPASTAYVVAFTDPGNAASQRVLGKSGFRYVGVRQTLYGDSATFFLDR